MTDCSKQSSVARQRECALDLAREVLEIEAEAITGLIAQARPELSRRRSNCILNCRGRVMVSGIGKSGHIARKIASTMASTGTPAYFVHPAEASHGDLGMITRDDVFIALSNSGRKRGTARDRAAASSASGAKLIAITGKPESTPGARSRRASVRRRGKGGLPAQSRADREHHRGARAGRRAGGGADACEGLRRATNSRARIPAARSGRKLLTHVRDVMRSGDDAPRIARHRDCCRTRCWRCRAAAWA